LKAAQILYEEGIAFPSLLGEKVHQEQMERYGINLDVPIIDPSDDDQKKTERNTEKHFGSFVKEKE
jgi:malate dehydrogenase (oxaloacetate-decarboxylating)(NADP+)